MNPQDTSSLPVDAFHSGDRVVANYEGQSVLGTIVEHRSPRECEGFTDYVYGYLVKLDGVQEVRVFTEDRLVLHVPPDEGGSGWDNLERMSGRVYAWRGASKEKR